MYNATTGSNERGAEGAPLQGEYRIGEELLWETWPARERPRQTVAVLIGLVPVWVVVYMIYPNVVLLLVCMAAVLGSLGRYFSRTRFRLSDEGVDICGLVYKIHKGWEEFRGVRVDRHGVLLSPFASESRLDAFRGTRLMFNKNGPEVVAFVKRKIEGRQRESE